jgi:hypothetical protein
MQLPKAIKDKIYEVCGTIKLIYFLLLNFIPQRSVIFRAEEYSSAVQHSPSMHKALD